MSSTLPKIQLPTPHSRLLLHSCCAPCNGAILDVLQNSGIEVTVFFYNPNIHPLQEYLLRKEENKQYAQKLGIEFVDADYNPKEWYAWVDGMQWEGERGLRCNSCFYMRFQALAKYAVENGFTLISSSLAISRWKNRQQVNTYGKLAAAIFANLEYWDYDWRKEGGAMRMLQVAKREQFYQQQYCGCSYSLRDSNNFRQSKGLPPIRFGENFYQNPQ